MKIRNGFVSNSSSSSFLVAFSKKPKSLQELKLMIFGDKNKDGYVNMYDYVFPVDEIYGQVMKDLPFKRLTLNEVIKEFGGYPYSYYLEYGYGCDRKIDIDKFVEQLELDPDRIFYNDIESTILLHKMITEQNEKEEKISKRIREIEKSSGIIIPAYNDPGYNSARKKQEKWESKNEELLELRRSRFLHDYFIKTNKLMNKIAKSDAKKFYEKHKGKFIARFSYSDNDGQFFTVMEHGGIFEGLDHIQFSHH